MIKIIRPLSYGELRMHLMHSELNGTTQGALSIRIEGDLNIERFFNSVEKIKQNYEILSAVIIQKDQKFFFATKTDAKTSNTILRIPSENHDNWLNVLNKENSIILDSKEQLWRIAVVPYYSSNKIFDIIIVMHHSVMDARAVDIFLNEVLSLTTEDNDNAINPKQTFNPIPKSAENSCISTKSWNEFVVLQKELQSKTVLCKPEKHKSKSKISDRKTHVQSYNLSKNEFNKILEFCDKHNTSFNSYCSAALLLAIKETSQEKNNFALYTAVSVHRLCPDVKDNDLGCYLSVIPTFHEISDNDVSINKLTTEHQEELQKSFLSYGRWLPKDYNTRDVLLAIEKLKEIDSFVSDIGFTYGESQLNSHYGNLKLKHSYVISRRSLGNLAIILHGLKLGEEVFFTFSHTEPSQNRNWAMLVMKNFKKILNDF